MSRLVAISPHLDDAVFSCGGTLARHAAQGHEVVLLTVFTRSVPDPQGFALACQTDKGLAADVDYMALRREEDRAAAAALGCAGAVHLDLDEAPHRGYDDALALFHGLREDDDAPKVAGAVLAVALAQLAPDLVLAPIGLGGHVDHTAVGRALDELGVPRLRWVDLPYALRRTAGAPLGDGEPVVVPIADQLEAKLAACACYTTQLGFQFGGVARMREQLTRYALDEGERLGAGGPAELLLRRSSLR